MAMGHVILKEYFVDRQVAVLRRLQQAVHRPVLPRRPRARGGDGAGPARPAGRPGKYLVAGDVERPEADSENAMWKPAVFDARTGELGIPAARIGDRYGDEGLGKWNLDLGDVDPALTLYGTRDARASRSRCPASTPRTARSPTSPGASRCVRSATGSSPPCSTWSSPSTAWGSRRTARRLAAGYDDTSVPRRPRGRRSHTGVPAAQVARLAREWAQNAIDTERPRDDPASGPGSTTGTTATRSTGRSCCSRRSPAPRAATAAAGRTTSARRRSGPIMGFQHMAFALDWHRPPRHINQTAYWYVHTVPVPLRHLQRRRPRRRHRGSSPARGSWTCCRSRCGWAGARATRPSTAAASTSPTTPRLPGWRPPPSSPRSSRRAG